ncbi:STAS-like domain-containing protein, partial [Dolichospermum circinale CS-537/05]|nr:STAS-like domain-containing protein [Dolichospermum circinale CS-537/05]
KTTNQGNGLWGLLGIIKDNSGSLSITSGSASLLIRNNESKSFSNIPFIDKNHQGTIIDFQIDVSQDIDIKAALGGYQPVNLFLENLENDTGEHCILIKDHTSGSGTRIAGEKIRTSVINIINMGASRIVLDFSEMGLISSSFADEFIGKLVVIYGFYGFQSIIRIKNMNEVSQAILHRSVAQRMMNSIEKK